MKSFLHKILAAVMAVGVLTAAFSPQTAHAATKAEIDTLIAHIPDSFPDAPEINSEAAILVEVSSGTILYGKNATRSMFPASTTKLMTAYLTLINSDLSSVITYSRTAIQSLEPGSSHIGLKIGESLTVEQSLYGLLLPSANEVANGLAESISGTISQFAELMNTTAVSLGCVNTNFANASGLHDPNHMTCAYDLYKVLEADIAMENFLTIATTAAYVKEPDELNANQIPMRTTNMFLRKDSELYDPDIICGKTGWTEEAGRCLTTYAKKGDLDLICVVMNSEAPNQYLDTEKLLTWAEENFRVMRPSEILSASNSGSTLSDSPLGLPNRRISLSHVDETGRIIVPRNINVRDLTTSESVAEDGTTLVTYKLEGYPLGSAEEMVGETSENPGLWSTERISILDQVQITDLHTINIYLIPLAAIVLILLILFLVLVIRLVNAPKEPEHKEDHHYHML